jgi:hypothetical protein
MDRESAQPLASELVPASLSPRACPREGREAGRRGGGEARKRGQRPLSPGFVGIASIDGEVLIVSFEVLFERCFVAISTQVDEVIY